jgi:tetratricopeptide (TPR) repeat protein
MYVAATLLAIWFARPDAYAHADPASDAADAEARIKHGLALRRERRDAEALSEFRLANALQPSGRALAQIALAEAAVGLWVEAEETFEEVLAERGDPWIEMRRPQLEDELHQIRSHLANLEVDITPADAKVWINGALAHVDRTSGAFRIVSGRVLVEVNRDGFEPGRRVFEIAPGAHLHDSVVLVETPPPAAAEPPDRSTEPVSSSPGTLVSTHTRRETPRWGVQRVLAISSLAAAGSAFLLGTVGAIERQTAASTYDDARCFYGSLPRNVRCAGVAADVNRFTTVMAAGYATAGAAAIVGTILALTAPLDLRVDVSKTPRERMMLCVTRHF